MSICPYHAKNNAMSQPHYFISCHVRPTLPTYLPLLRLCSNEAEEAGRSVPLPAALASLQPSASGWSE